MKRFCFAVIPAVTKTFSKNFLLLNFLYYIYSHVNQQCRTLAGLSYLDDCRERLRSLPCERLLSAHMAHQAFSSSPPPSRPSLERRVMTIKREANQTVLPKETPHHYSVVAPNLTTPTVRAGDLHDNSVDHCPGDLEIPITPKDTMTNHKVLTTTKNTRHSNRQSPPPPPPHYWPTRAIRLMRTVSRNASRIMIGTMIQT